MSYKNVVNQNGYPIITFYSCCVQRRVEEGSEKGQWRKMAGRGRSKGDQH